MKDATISVDNVFNPFYVHSIQAGDLKAAVAACFDKNKRIQQDLLKESVE